MIEVQGVAEQTALIITIASLLTMFCKACKTTRLTAYALHHSSRHTAGAAADCRFVVGVSLEQERAKVFSASETLLFVLSLAPTRTHEGTPQVPGQAGSTSHEG